MVSIRGTDEGEHLPLGVETTDWRAAPDPLRSDWTGTVTLEVGTPGFDHVEDSPERPHALLRS